MKRRNRGVVALAVLLALGAAACDSSTDSVADPSTATAAAGGTLYYLTDLGADHLDPQRTYYGRDVVTESRLLYRTLTTYAVADGKGVPKLVPDLSADTGVVSNGGKTWTFALKPDLKWQDGSPIVCDDFRYGVSRTFATAVITGGPNYAIQFLDIPVNGEGGSMYKGPYTPDPAGQALFDKSITCDGATITFRLKKPVGDFNYAVTMPAFAPYKREQDQGDKSNYAVFSSGPYKLEGTWAKGKGGAFVRNDQWDPATDGIRRALPDRIVFTEGLQDEVIAQRLISDNGNDRYAVSDRLVPPAMRAQVKSGAATTGRFEIIDAQPVEYLVPNFRKLTNPLVRQALLLSTDKRGWVTANGGTDAGAPARSIINPSVAGYREFNVFDAPDEGDAVKAKALLTQAGVKFPYPITLIYPGGTPTSAKGAAALKGGWEKAGFAVTANGLTDTFGDVIRNPADVNKYDVVMAGWGADWPNASTVIPPLFDSRVNLSEGSNGQDIGYYQNDLVNKAIDDAFAITDLDQQAAKWGEVDEQLSKDVAYIPLRTLKFFLVWGSGVKGWVDNPGTNNFPDLGALGVK